MSVEKLDLSFVRQENRSFTTLYNHVIQGIEDAFTLGVYCYLSSLPHDWIVNKQHLMNHFKVGRDKISFTMKWLNDNHLIENRQERNSDGTLCKNIIIVKDGSEFNKPVNGFTVVRENRSTDLPEYGKSATTNKIDNTNKNIEHKINIKAQPKKQVAVVIVPEWLDKQTWEDFKQFRKEMKKPMTELIQKKTIHRLDKMRSEGQNVEDVLNQSIANGWQGVFEVKSTKERNYGNQQSTQRKPHAQRIWELSTLGLPEYENSRGNKEVSQNTTGLSAATDFLF